MLTCMHMALMWALLKTKSRVYNLEGARICYTEEEFQQRISAVSSGS